MATLDDALRQFELAEANLGKLDRLWEKIEGILPKGPAFGSPPQYDEWCIAFERILAELPAVDGFRVENHLYDYDEAGQMHFDALELGDFEARVHVVQLLAEQGDQLSEYRIRFQAKRRELVRGRLIECIDDLDQVFASFDSGGSTAKDNAQRVLSAWNQVRELVAEIDTLLGSRPRPHHWGVLRKQHEADGAEKIIDVWTKVWPNVRAALSEGLYGELDPIPVAVGDLGAIVDERPAGPVSMRLNWSLLSAEDFERLVYQLISEAEAYENARWLQKTHAPDRCTDLSADRLDADALGGARRYRTIIQCKHWLSKSVGPNEVGGARDAMAHWEPPRVDALVIVTSGRFTADAVAMVEKHNQGDRALTIDMWPESHLESLLAARPHLIGQFGLRGG